MQKQRAWLNMAAIMGMFISCGLLASHARAANSSDYARYASTARMILPQGTVIPVTLDQTLSSATNHTGDTFTVTVRSPQNGDNEFPAGTKIAGVISDVQRKASGQPGMLDVTFQQARFPNGQKIPLQGSLLSLDEKSVTQQPDGRIMARDTTSKDRLKFIAIGAGAGLIIGKLTKNTLLGGLIGAIAGYLYSERSANKSTEAIVNAGTVFGVRIDRELAFTANGTFASARKTYRQSPHASTDYLAQGQVITITLDGREINIGVPPAFEDQGNVFIPLTPVMTVTRTPFTYDELQQTVLVNTDQGELYLKVGKSYALLQGDKEMLEAPAVVQQGILFVTPHYLALATNLRVVWSVTTHTVTMLNGAVPYTTAFPDGQDVTVTVRGQRVPLGTDRSFLVGKTILLPLTQIMNAANVPYTYNEKWQNVRVDTDGGVLYLTIDNAYALLEGTQASLETPAQVINGQVYVPLRFLSLATGLTTRWNAQQQTVTMN